MVADKKKPPAKKAAVVDDDEEIDDPLDMAKRKPVAKKPALGKKPAPKADAEEKKAPALSSSKPSGGGGGASGPVKPLTVDMIVEDDIGPGMSKETAMAKAEEFYSSEVLSALEDANKWN